MSNVIQTVTLTRSSRARQGATEWKDLPDRTSVPHGGAGWARRRSSTGEEGSPGAEITGEPLRTRGARVSLLCCAPSHSPRSQRGAAPGIRTWALPRRHVKMRVCRLGAAPISPRQRSVPRNFSPESCLSESFRTGSRMLEPMRPGRAPNHFPGEHSKP